MKRGLVRLLIGTALVLLCTSCVIYEFGGGTGPWDFDDSTSFPDGFTANGDYPWTVDSMEYHSEYNSAQSGAPDQYFYSTLELDVGELTEEADIHFYYKISATSLDYLEFYVNDVWVRTYYGADSYGTWMEADIWDSSEINTYSTNTLKWRYYRGSYTTYYDNCAWIDDVVIDGM